MHALQITRAEDFSAWYQTLVREADLAELSPTRGCMIIKPWGMGIWERLQRELDDRIKAAGHDNYYFPLLIPLSFFAAEAEHVEGFAKEMAVVTHHRLTEIDGTLQPDPAAALTEPLIIRPTSETIIGDAFSRWIKSYRDLPLKLNQWANIMRWEMRTRMFLRTAEFLWQEGHTAHVDREDAVTETMWALEMYRTVAEDVLAIPVIAGVKPENERFPGAEDTYSLEAMMQDGKALQAATSHYLGTHFAEAQDIRFQDKDGGRSLAHTTSWGMTTRMIGAMIMTHGDDDGLRTPPAVAPKQIVIVPMLRGKPEDGELTAFCAALMDELCKLSVFGAPLRAFVDMKDARPADKRWDWVRRGAPIICEIGPRDAGSGHVTFIKRHALRAGEKVKSHTVARSEFIQLAASLLEATQGELFREAKVRLDSNIRDGFTSFADLERYFGEDKDGECRGWARVHWAKPTGAALAHAGERLKALQLTIRNAPLQQPNSFGTCIFTGAPGVEEILIARAY
ncbi:MAG: proline--tRNA ligase [Candidatus Tectomicrobia bacterium]|uniref:Proline--tRNA ligase n=1 Tax=Tectimicrobiota bacterium TaxID=2528274 RepID=A0A937VZ68_UNCTE|nr:proline--tRNA ligase [Candidatus Tectomicrobia bacterium]